MSYHLCFLVVNTDIVVCVLLHCCDAILNHLQDGTTPLWIACQEGHLRVVEHLITMKADVNIPDEVGYLLCITTARNCAFSIESVLSSWAFSHIKITKFSLHHLLSDLHQHSSTPETHTIACSRCTV